MRVGYAISPGTHICRVGASWVFLDTKHDRYVCLTGAAAERFLQLTRSHQDSELGQDILTLANRLLERGLLIATDQSVDPIAPPLIPQPHSSIAREEHGSAGPIRLIELARFTAQFARSSHLRNPKRRNLVQIIDEARQLKIDAQKSRPKAGSEIAALTRSFHAIVPWFFTEHDACFFRSYLLLRYLATFGAAADWTFAVRLSPFRAHCWVSADGVILNEDFHAAAGYEPILVV